MDNPPLSSWGDFCYRFKQYVPYRIRHAYDKVNEFLFPRQRWLTKAIPKSWIDKDTLWEIAIIEGLKHYVEQDNGGAWFKHLDDDSAWQDGGEDMKEFHEASRRFHRAAKEHYDLVTKTLPDLEWKLEKAWEKVPHFNFDNLNDNTRSYDQIYGDVDKLDEQISELKTKVMLWAVTNRASIWT
jgi:hypothetical protein